MHVEQEVEGLQDTTAVDVVITADARAAQLQR